MVQIEELSPYPLRTVDGIVKKNMPGKLFFFFVHRLVPLYCTYVLCTQRRRNISLIGRIVVGILLVIEWVYT